MKAVLLLLAAGVFAAPTFGAMLASDDASQSAYGDGLQVGDNGGSGFLAWSTINRDNESGFGGAFIGAGNTDIGTGGSNEVFGVFGNDGGVGQAIRPFDGNLTVGQTFSIDMDNGGINDGGTVGFGLRNSGGQNRLEFFFVGGQATYTIVDNSGVVNTGVGYTTAGLSLAFTLTGTDTYSFTINNGTPIVGTLAGTAGTGVDRVRLFNANGGPDVFFNSLAIVPEPASLALVGAGLMLMSVRRRTA